MFDLEDTQHNRGTIRIAQRDPIPLARKRNEPPQAALDVTLVLVDFEHPGSDHRCARG